ncbi:hypothetical protein CLF_111089 [Clonorchis sinensis]|uniref:Uncharacterized protein n=1 Tax=Clonorchis sinensis TaxID=79923 RepID=G7YUC0_CLOSI|nr:hypothetical protein CLF_111089 [Clonorchis sinensis]
MAPWVCNLSTASVEEQSMMIAVPSCCKHCIVRQQCHCKKEIDRHSFHSAQLLCLASYKRPSDTGGMHELSTPHVTQAVRLTRYHVTPNKQLNVKYFKRMHNKGAPICSIRFAFGREDKFKTNKCIHESCQGRRQSILLLNKGTFTKVKRLEGGSAKRPRDRSSNSNPYSPPYSDIASCQRTNRPGLHRVQDVRPIVSLAVVRTRERATADGSGSTMICSLPKTYKISPRTDFTVLCKPYHQVTYALVKTVANSTECETSITESSDAQRADFVLDVGFCERIERELQPRLVNEQARRDNLVDLLNCALTMSPRLRTKRLQANCQARRTDQLPPTTSKSAGLTTVIYSS